MTPSNQFIINNIMKIVYYGNCQMEKLEITLRRFLNISPVKPSEWNCKAESRNNNCVFQPWAMTVEQQNECFKRVVDAVENCDVFITQHLKLNDGSSSKGVYVEELTSAYLGNKSKRCIVIPNFRYMGYCVYYRISIHHIIIHYLLQKLVSVEDITYFLNHATLECLDDAFNLCHKSSVDEMKIREKNAMNDHPNGTIIKSSAWIDETKSNKFQGNEYYHPTAYYYQYLLDQLSSLLSSDLPYKFVENILNSETSIDECCLYNFFYFRKQFPNMISLHSKETSNLRVTSEFVQHCKESGIAANHPYEFHVIKKNIHAELDKWF